MRFDDAGISIVPLIQMKKKKAKNTHAYMHGARAFRPRPNGIIDAARAGGAGAGVVNVESSSVVPRRTEQRDPTTPNPDEEKRDDAVRERGGGGGDRSFVDDRFAIVLKKNTHERASAIRRTGGMNVGRADGRAAATQRRKTMGRPR